MAAAPAAAAVWADVLWCLGLGCLLGAGRDILGLVLGNGPVRCFCWDLLAFAAAAVLVCGFSAGVSASGLARWYMAAALLAGALAWGVALAPGLHRAVAVLAGLLLYPLRALHRRLCLPLRRRIAATAARKRQKNRKKLKKAEKNGKKQLQKPSKILYN